MPDAVEGAGERPLVEQAAVYLFFHHLFRTPSKEQWEWLTKGAARGAWKLIARSLEGDHPKRLPLGRTFQAYEETFLAAFEVGFPSPACPLIESHWNKREALPRILHENVMYYQRFGLRLRSQANETADHLRHQMEFLHYLVLLQCRYEEAGDAAAGQVALARREFLDRHLFSWVPDAARSLAERRGRRSWPSRWMNLLEAFLCGDSCKIP